MTDRVFREAADSTPDPNRALKNLETFSGENPAFLDQLLLSLRPAAVLFSQSQFLANYCTAFPDALFDALAKLHQPPDRETLMAALDAVLDETASLQPHARLQATMNAVRRFKTQTILSITLRDLLKQADLVDVMADLSLLADVVADRSVRFLRGHLAALYGEPRDDAFSVIALGKLGGDELNFSSDVDFMYVYGTEAGETAGVRTEQGIVKNRIANHEFYCKLGEALTRFLSANTEAGFAYRVDLRLRPEGQRGDISLAIRGYEMYYESWGRAWERAMLLRARPVAGDAALGQEFLGMIRPFVYRKYLDFSAIDEIKKLKTRIDATFKKGDIKRGYGGIREIEFFAQALQLLYAGREPMLRERSVLRALHKLLQKGIIGQSDFQILSENYRWLRTLEHRLQQVNDIQTHTIPTGEADLEALGRKMGCSGRMDFLEELDARRKAVRSIYDSLFAEQQGAQTHSGTLFDEDFSDAELQEFLAGLGLRDPGRACRNIRAIRDAMISFQTLRGRRLLGEILPDFVDAVLRTDAPDTALNHLQTFAVFLSSNESYLEVFRRNRELTRNLAYVFAHSDYLAKMLMARPRYLEMIGWQSFRRKSLAALRGELRAEMRGGRPVTEAVRQLKQMEEIRWGLEFIQGRADVDRMTKGLSKAAESVLAACADEAASGRRIAVVGFGKLGGREITFNSDLDIIFVTQETPEIEDVKAAERVLRLLISYTRDGIAYRVDTRLRPEGSRGPLVSSVDAFRSYYEKSAAFWELQALLKARPVAGDRRTGCAFMEVAYAALAAHGSDVEASDIRQMRERILRERAKESEGFDIKLGRGGIEEIEFLVQFLQLRHAAVHRAVLVQGTAQALRRLASAGVIGRDEADFLGSAYRFYRSLETFLRLRGEAVLGRNDPEITPAAKFFGYDDSGRFLDYLERTQERTAGITRRVFAS
ncbi:MAG: bifunctional [glutamate--ammonia ligase]-adenylyl-L-tyrosine phosphorylase/[glutamate--ammonia-ligase] adenylyltransferase [Thermodesulfovibrionales bacterium]